MQLSELWTRGWEFPGPGESVQDERFRGQPAMKNHGRYFLPFTSWPHRTAHVPSLAYLVMGDTRQVDDGIFYFLAVELTSCKQRFQSQVWTFFDIPSTVPMPASFQDTAS